MHTLFLLNINWMGVNNNSSSEYYVVCMTTTLCDIVRALIKRRHHPTREIDSLLIYILKHHTHVLPSSTWCSVPPDRKKITNLKKNLDAVFGDSSDDEEYLPYYDKQQTC